MISRKKYRHTKIIKFLVLFVSLLLVTSCDQTEQEQTKTPTSIKIGAILPLTGYVSYLGEEEKNVLLMAQQEINANPANPTLEIEIEDSKSSAKDGVSAYQKLRLQSIKYFLTALTIVSQAVQPLCEQEHFLQFALSIHPDIAKAPQYLFRPYYGLETEMKLVADYLPKRKAKKVAALYINTPEAQVTMDKYFKKNLNANQIQLIGTETYGFTDKTVKNQLLKLKKLNPDFIVTVDFGYMYPIILKEAQTLGIRQKIIGGLGMMTAPPMPSTLTEGILFASASFVITPSTKYQDFAKKYEARYKKKVTFDGVYTYDSVRMLYSHIKEQGDNTNSLLNTTYQGISGPIHIDAEGTGQVDISLAQFDKTGKIQKVK